MTTASKHTIELIRTQITTLRSLREEAVQEVGRLEAMRDAWSQSVADIDEQLSALDDDLVAFGATEPEPVGFATATLVVQDDGGHNLHGYDEPETIQEEDK